MPSSSKRDAGRRARSANARRPRAPSRDRGHCPSGVELSPMLIAALPAASAQSRAVSRIEPTMVRTAQGLVGSELETRAGVHHQVADAGEQMLEEGPGQADQHDQSRAGSARPWRRSRKRPAPAKRHQPPGEDRQAREGQRGAGDAVEDRNEPCAAPSARSSDAAKAGGVWCRPWPRRLRRGRCRGQVSPKCA